MVSLNSTTKCLARVLGRTWDAHTFPGVDARISPKERPIELQKRAQQLMSYIKCDTSSQVSMQHDSNSGF